MNAPPTLHQDGKHYELLSGPFNKYEEPYLNKCIRDLGKIAYKIAEIQGEKYIYRDAKGYIQLEEQVYEYKYRRPRLNEAKLFLAEIAREVQEKRTVRHSPKKMEPMIQMR